MKRKRHNIESVRAFVENESNCSLLSEEFKNVDTKMDFLCECGNVFSTTFYKFEKRNKRQCNDCGRKKASEFHRLTYEEVKNFIEVESNSGCTLISKEYKNAQAKLKIQCSCGNFFHTKWSHFKNSNQRQCSDCGTEMRAQSRRLPIEYVESVIESRGCKLKDEYKNSVSKLKIQCSCGNFFHTSFALFEKLDVDKCTECRSVSIRSKGEMKISSWLSKHGIDFQEEYTLQDLKIVNKLRFDFAIFNSEKELKLLIEFDGKQHFGLGLFSDDTDEMIAQYNKVLHSDYIKNEYCFANGIPLLRIPYNKYSSIDAILKRSLL